jgi:hypothetical protein
MNTKRIVTLALVMFSAVATTLAQSTRQIGAWSIYTIQASGKNTVMLQTAAVAQNGAAQDGSGVTTLSILCKNNKLSAIALHTDSGIDKHAVSYTEDVPLTPVVASIEGRNGASEKWAVTEKGHTFSPYSEVLQGKVNREWLQRLNGAHAVAFQLGGAEGDNNLQPTFHTEQLGEALAAAGCTN